MRLHVPGSQLQSQPGFGGNYLGPVSFGGQNSAYHLYVYSGGDSPPLYQRGVVSQLGGTLNANDAVSYLGFTGWAAMTSGGFNNTGNVRGASILGQGSGVGGNWAELTGGYFSGVLGGSATATEINGVQGLVANNGTANATTGYALRGLWNKGSTGLVATIFGSFIEAPPSGWGATLAAAFSCAWSSAANRYGIYMSGTVLNHLGGALNVVGAISIGNTVAAGVGVASTHKVTISIGGNTYYLLASNV